MFDQKITDKIELVLIREEFVSEYVDLVSDDFDYLSEWLEWPRFCRTEQDFRKFVANSDKGYEAGESMNCTILYNGSVAGVSGFTKIDPTLRRAELGYWLGAKYQKKGIATVVCRYLIQHAFSNPEIDKIQVSVAVGNTASRAVCERLEMKLEGIISNVERIGSNVLDHAIYALHREKT